MRYVVVLILVTGLSGCGMFSPEAGEIGTAKRVVADRMRDPESVRFRDVRIQQQPDGTRAVCGFVNARNAYGGYVGYEPFFYYQGRVGLNDSAEETQQHIQLCYDAATRAEAGV